MEITPPRPPRRLRRGTTPFSEHPRAKYWSKKNKLKPHEVALNSHTKYWFDCDKCHHEFDSGSSSVNNGCWCPYCCISPKLCGDIKCEFCLKKSFAIHKRAKCWSDKNKLKPHEVTLSTHTKYWFDCDKCHHDFESAVYNVSMGRWCPYCCIPCKKSCGDIKCEFCFKKSFASHEKAKYWSKKNDKILNHVKLHSNKKYWFDCDKCPHEFEIGLNKVNRGDWCPYCSNHRLCGDIECEFCLNKSFASHKKAKYWSPKNKLTPNQVALHSGKKCWFDCDKCPHDFESALYSVSNGHWCPYCCHNPKLCGDIKCEFCLKKSFASHKRAKCWSPKNKLKPHEVTLHSDKKCWFDCDKCHHDFESTLDKVSNGHWCPICKNKTEKKLLEWLQKQSFIKNVKCHWRPEWCSTKFIYLNKKGKYKKGKYQYEYDFLVTFKTGKQVIIELDGPQHFQNVPHFKSIALHQQIRDAYKERCARCPPPSPPPSPPRKKIPTIRILQEDVWYDRNDWEDMFLRKIKTVN